MTLINLIIIVILLILLKRVPVDKLLQYENQLVSLEKNQARAESMIKEEMARNREEAGSNARQGREELNNALKLFTDSFLARMTEISVLQKNQLDAFAGQLSTLTRLNEEKLEKMRATVEERLQLLQTENSRKLDQMRAVVDEKLHATLEQRLGESFKQVSERLELVHQGLGEMQSLASGVGDLKKVLTNVKTRGIWGEVQLGNLLEQILTVDQYAVNVATKKGSSERVEFAVKLPARDDSGSVIWLPIDAKFPLEDYQKLIEAQEQANSTLIEETGKLLENRIKAEAKEIKEKYLDPPNTTDFGILFLPVEGLYAEVLRRPGLAELLQRQHRVVVTGPTTLAALLNSLQMGFRTLAVAKRSSEVWALLGAVKTEFVKFGDILEKTQKKLQEASNTIENAAQKSRAIQRKLKDVQELPAPEAVSLLGPMEETAAGNLPDSE